MVAACAANAIRTNDIAVRNYGIRFASLTDKISKSSLLVASALLLVISLPALGQQGPESLLPEGFGDPAPPPPASVRRPTPAAPGTVAPSAAPTEGDPTAEADAETEEETPVQIPRGYAPKP